MYEDLCKPLNVEKNIRLYTGTGNPELAQRIANVLHLELSGLMITKFANGEIYARFEETVRGCEVFFVQSIAGKNVNDLLMETLIVADAATRASAASFTAVIPHYGYARQDRKAASREPITARLVANLLEAAGVDRVITLDLHSNQIQGFFDIPVDNLLGNPVFVKYYLAKFSEAERENMVVVSPDVGSVARARTFAQKVGMGLAIVDKRRQKANSCEVMNIIGDVEGKDCILFDDMIDTAGSLCNACTALREVGGAKKLYGCASHGVLSGPALDRIENSYFEEVRILDTIPMPAGYTGTKIKQLSVAEMFAEAITRIDEEVSISSLF